MQPANTDPGNRDRHRNDENDTNGHQDDRDCIRRARAQHDAERDKQGEPDHEREHVEQSGGSVRGALRNERP